MPVSQNSNRIQGLTILIALSGLGLLWLLFLRPIREQIKTARQHGVISAHEAIPTMEQETFNVRIALATRVRQAAEHKHWDQVSGLLAQGLGVDENLGGCTLLMLAAQQGDLKALNSLVAKGCKIDAQNPNGDTALHFAVRNGQHRAMEFLLANGADINHETRFQLRVLDLAIVEHDQWAYTFLKHRGVKENIMQAVRMSDVEAADRLLKQGANINGTYPAMYESVGPVPSAQGDWLSAQIPYPIFCTPLAAALDLKLWDIAEWLLTHGANVDQQDTLTNTALMRAAQNGNVQGVRFLLRHHARTDIKRRGKEDARSDAMNAIKFQIKKKKEYQDIFALLNKHAPDKPPRS